MAAEGVHALAVGVAGVLIAGEQVDRMAVVGDLAFRLRAGGGPSQRAFAPLPAVGWPVARSGGQAVAHAPVQVLVVPSPSEQIQGAALGVHQDLAQAAAGDLDRGRRRSGRRGRCRRGAGTPAAAATGGRTERNKWYRSRADQQTDGSTANHDRSFPGRSQRIDPVASCSQRGNPPIDPP